MTTKKVCEDCGWKFESYTHAYECPVGIVESDNAVEKVRMLLKVQSQHWNMKMLLKALDRAIDCENNAEGNAEKVRELLRLKAQH